MQCFFPGCQAPESAVKLVAVMIICKSAVSLRVYVHYQGGGDEDSFLNSVIYAKQII